MGNANPTGTVSYVAELDSFLDILSRVGHELSPQTIAAKQFRATGWTITSFFCPTSVLTETPKEGGGQVSGVG